MPFNANAFQKDIMGQRFSDSGLPYSLMIKSTPETGIQLHFFFPDIIPRNSEEKKVTFYNTE